MVTTIQEFDLIQRIRVEDGIPRVISTNIRVIEGGEDLFSLAIDILKKLGFYNRFTEKMTSQYTAYRLNNPKKGAKRYQLILSRHADRLSISIPKNIVDPYLLKLGQEELAPISGSEEDILDQSTWEMQVGYSIWWIRPCFKEDFLKIIKKFGYKQEIRDDSENYYIFPKDYDSSECHKTIAETGYAINIVATSSLFPYTIQLLIDSKEVLEDCLNYFVKILMEQ